MNTNKNKQYLKQNDLLTALCNVSHCCAFLHSNVAEDGEDDETREKAGKTVDNRHKERFSATERHKLATGRFDHLPTRPSPFDHSPQSS